MTLLIVATLGAALIAGLLYLSIGLATKRGDWFSWAVVGIQSTCLAFQVLNVINAIHKL